MGNKEQIYEFLIDNRRTIKEIVVNMKFSGKYPINEARMYVKRLIDENKVKELPKDGREIVYTAMKQDNKLQTLKKGILEFNKLMSIIKPIIPQDINKNNISEAVKLCHTI